MMRAAHLTCSASRATRCVCMPAVLYIRPAWLSTVFFDRCGLLVIYDRSGDLRVAVFPNDGEGTRRLGGFTT